MYVLSKANFQFYNEFVFTLQMLKLDTKNNIHI